jgi:putative acetyltransferase
MRIRWGVAAGETAGEGGFRPVEVVPVDPRAPVAAGLLRRLHNEVSSSLEDDRPEPGTVPRETGFTVFVLARDPKNGVGYYGCGGLRYLGEGVADISSLYVVPEQRGSRAADTVLAWLEDYARSRNYSALRLETRAGWLPANRFFERNGYTPNPRCGVDGGSREILSLEKALRPY